MLGLVFRKKPWGSEDRLITETLDKHWTDVEVLIRKIVDGMEREVDSATEFAWIAKYRFGSGTCAAESLGRRTGQSVKLREKLAYQSRLCMISSTVVSTRSSAVAERPCDASYHWIFRYASQGHSRSLEIAPFDRSRTSSYWCSIVTIAPFCVI